MLGGRRAAFKLAKIIVIDIFAEGCATFASRAEQIIASRGKVTKVAKGGLTCCSE